MPVHALKHFCVVILITILAAGWPVSEAAAKDFSTADFALPSGFTIELFADNISGARSLARGDQGTIFVGTRKRDRVYALVDEDQDFKVDRTYIIARNLVMPNGVAFHDGSLYVAEFNRIIRFDDIEKKLGNPPLPVIINDTFPTEKHHGWKFIAFGPDGKLYVPIGAPCNVCLEDDDRFATITRMHPDGNQFEIFAHGVRNSVGFDWHPVTGELWFTDNGRDWLGDDLPPDELNRAPEKGLHFGFPFWHGRTIADPEFGEGRKASEFTLPVRELGPHVAALGMRFYTGTMFPEEYRNQVFIAEHGSWNRSTKIGYRVMLVRLKNNRAVSYEPFAEGWLKDGKVIGRPVDLLVLPDGSLLVSDDDAGRIYRISYQQGM